MPADALPIVFRTKPSTSLVALAFGVMIAGVGIWKIATDDYAEGGGWLGPVYLDARTTMWLLVVVGAPLVIYGLLTIVRGCPTLTLDDTGVLLVRCLQSPVKVPWPRVTDVRVRSSSIPARGRVTPVELVYVVTDDGKEVCVGNFGAADALADTIWRVAGQMKGPQGAAT